MQFFSEIPDKHRKTVGMIVILGVIARERASPPNALRSLTKGTQRMWSHTQSNIPGDKEYQEKVV
jgi:hypothetical protein